MNPYLDIMRPKHWVKNLLVFVPLILSGLISVNFLSLFLVFLSVCFVSSAGYILNDIYNVEEDKRNHKTRPLATGAINNKQTVAFLAFGLLFTSMILSPIVSVLFILDFFYTIIARKYKYIDIITIAVKYPIRLLIGYIIIGIAPNIFLLSITFCFAGVLAVMKRKGEYLSGMVKKKKDYTIENLDKIFTAVGLVYVTTLYIFIAEITQTWIFIPWTLSITNAIAITRYYSDIKDYRDSKSLAILKDKWFFASSLIIIGVIICMTYAYVTW